MVETGEEIRVRRPGRHGSREPGLCCANGSPNGLSSGACLEGTNHQIRESCITHVVRYPVSSRRKMQAFGSRLVCESVASGDGQIQRQPHCGYNDRIFIDGDEEASFDRLFQVFRYPVRMTELFARSRATHHCTRSGQRQQTLSCNVTLRGDRIARSIPLDARCLWPGYRYTYVRCVDKYGLCLLVRRQEN